MTIDDAELPIERSERMEIVLRKDHDEIVARLRTSNAELVAALAEIAEGADAKAFVRSRARAAIAKAKQQT